MKSILNFKRACVALCTMSLLGLSSSALAADWTVPGTHATIQAAIDDPAVVDGDTIRVGPGDFAGATVNKEVEIKGQGGARIVSGPAFSTSLIQGFRLTGNSSGATISHFTFTTDVDLAIYSRFEANGLGGADNVTVTQCTFLNNIQAITNWGGIAWEISHNTITDLRTSCGGGIGILIGDRFNRVDGVTDNVVSHNTISGQLTVPEGDCGDYNGSGIVIYADFRAAGWGGLDISYNRVVKNKVSMTVDNLGSVDPVSFVAFEMTDTRDAVGVIHHNAIGFNDFRGNPEEIVLSAGLDNPANDISRNFGENRGHGIHPSVF